MPSFNSRARKGRDTPIGPTEGTFVVSIHAPARGATAIGTYDNFTSRFQFTRPQGARPSRRRESAASRRGFNSRARKGRDVRVLSERSPSDRFQFTRPQGARLDATGTPHYESEVSIHAPARGATGGAVVLYRVYQVSIHAPARGATVNWRTILWLRSCFNSRARKGRDTGTWPTLPQMNSFNSRARKGRDVQVGIITFAQVVSIHAPARGATTYGNTRLHWTRFQFTRPQGARLDRLATI